MLNPISSASAKRIKHARMLIAALKQGPVSTRDAADLLGQSRSNTHLYLNTLLKAGVIIQQPHLIQNEPRVFLLTSIEAADAFLQQLDQAAQRRITDPSGLVKLGRPVGKNANRAAPGEETGAARMIEGARLAIRPKPLVIAADPLADAFFGRQNNNSQR